MGKVIFKQIRPLNDPMCMAILFKNNLSLYFMLKMVPFTYSLSLFSCTKISFIRVYEHFPTRVLRVRDVQRSVWTLQQNSKWDPHYGEGIFQNEKKVFVLSLLIISMCLGPSPLSLVRQQNTAPSPYLGPHSSCRVCLSGIYVSCLGLGASRIQHQEELFLLP